MSADAIAAALDAIDRKILALLQENGRLTNNEIAGRVGLSPSPCLRRIRLLEQKGVIRDYVALLDPAAFGLDVNVFVSVTMDRQDEANSRRFREAVASWPRVMECYLMTGEADFLLRVLVPTLASHDKFLRDVLTKVPGVANIKSSFALNQVKYRTALPLD